MMRSGRLIGLAIVLMGLSSGCARFEPRPASAAPAGGAEERAAAESERAELAQELSLYSD